MKQQRIYSYLMMAPATLMVIIFFLYPLACSLLAAVTDDVGRFSWAPMAKAWMLYHRDLFYSLLVVGLSLVAIAGLTVIIAGILTLSPFARLNKLLAILYRWPLFIPFIVVAQMMRTFLAKNGLMNNTLVELHLLTPLQTVSFLDWRGLIFTFVWKQLAFSTLLVAGAMAVIPKEQLLAAENLGASRFRIFFTVLLAQVLPNLGVALILSCVTMMSVLSVPLMLETGQVNMLTTDIAFRVNSYGDYSLANALGFFSYLVTASVAWVYLYMSYGKNQQK